MSTRVLRFTVPVDDRVVRRFCGPGRILHVDSRTPDAVEFWTEVEGVAEGTAGRLFVVVGTGHEVPEGGVVIGSALSPSFTTEHGVRHERGALVWHLVEMAVGHDQLLERLNAPGGVR